ncbi:MAG: beta-N-acetylhexosaminidase, partial [Psychroserpens sp.]|nr:beta-N-acetylhexosaminidase [Psychroserpens sp.]
MYLKKFLVLCVFISFLSSCTSEKQITDNPSIIPIPNHLNINEGKFELNAETTVMYPKEFEITGAYVTDWLGIKPFLKSVDNNQIVFVKEDSISNPEGYALEITEDHITIKSSTDRGAFYAVQSLRQLMPPTLEVEKLQDPIKMPCLIITDEPRFQYRGMHLDVGRHMFSTKFIKKYIDAMAMLKMNTFHWHLTEDQGWRIEIKAYPKLQEIAAYRNETLIGHYSDQPHQFDGERYGGYYTQEEIKDIVAYAQS